MEVRVYVSLLKPPKERSRGIFSWGVEVELEFVGHR
jgi:hypothetical protein